MTAEGRSPGRIGRRLLLGGLAGSVVGTASRLGAQEVPRPRFLRIATGDASGTYFQVGGLVAEIVGSPVGSRPCEDGGDCGVAGLVAVAQSSPGSVANVGAIERGEVESGFAQGDVAHFAYTGTEVFAGAPPARNLRALANLYPESLHLVVRREAGVERVADLRGRRVSLGADGSGTTVGARLVLAAHGLADADLQASRTPLGPSIDLMKAGRLDAFFLVAGWPAPGVGELARDLAIRLVPVEGPPREALLARHPFFSPDLIPPDAYPGVSATPTVAVGAQWLVASDLDPDLVHGLAAALWHPSARARLESGHPRAGGIRIETALKGVTVPVHPGAERYYRAHGVLP